MFLGFFNSLQHILCTEGAALSYPSLLLIFILAPMHIKLLFTFHQFTEPEEKKKKDVIPSSTRNSFHRTSKLKQVTKGCKVASAQWGCMEKWREERAFPEHTCEKLSLTAAPELHSKRKAI